MTEFRTIDGSGYNGNQGETNMQLIRHFGNHFNAYEDYISVPRGGPISEFDPLTQTFVDTSNLPNPRYISNIVAKQVKPVTNFLNASDWLWQWGQFLDHDFALNEDNPEQKPRGEYMPIPVPHDDPTFSKESIIPLIRVPAAEGTGYYAADPNKKNPRQINNQITAYIDASSVYGSDDERAEFLRDSESGKGLLKTWLGDNGEVLLPLNLIGENAYPNATGGLLGDFQYIAGDVRANEHIGLTAVHNLLVREHNRIALGLHERLEAGDKALIEKYEDFKDYSQVGEADLYEEEIKDEFLYQSARKVIGAQVQIISYKEFLPLLIGKNSLAKYKGYDPDINPQISVEFANAAYRLGHTLVSNQLLRVDSNGMTETSLAEAFFNPEDVQTNGVDTLLTGLIFQGAEEVDNQIVDGVREFLFPAGTGGFDLAAINIARGREVGIPSYTEVYKKIFGTEISSFSKLHKLGLFSKSVVNLFKDAYESVDQIDLWLGGVSELPAKHGGLLGPTLSYFVADQFARSRDGDKFFYLNDLEHLHILAPDIEYTNLADLIRNNVADPYLVPDDAFKVPYEKSIYGDDSHNVLKGNRRDDLIEGKGGNDKIHGRGGRDILFGGWGDDKLYGNGGADKIFGGDGKDELYGNGGKDYLHGGAGADYIRGGAGADYIRGGTGDDYIRGGAGPDTYLFGSKLLDYNTDWDVIKDFQKIDYLDFNDYLGAGGTLEYERIGHRHLQIHLSGEDVIDVYGSHNAITGAEYQLKEHLA